MSLLSEFKGNVNLSSDTGTSTTVGTTLKVNTVEAKAATDAIALYNNATSGTLTMGSALTSNLLLGSTSNTTQVQGTLVANSLNPKSASANMTIASISTNATLTVGGSMTSSGGITLGSAASSTTVNGTLKTNTINSTGVLKINETNNVETAINSGTTSAQSLTLGTIGYTTQYIRGTTVNINEAGSGNTVIGTSGGTGTNTFNRPFTIGYTIQPIAGQIGHTVVGTLPADTTVFSGLGTYTLASMTALGYGVYIVNANIQFFATSPIKLQPNLQTNFTTSNIPVAPIIGVSPYYTMNASQVFYSQVGDPISPNVYMVFDGTSFSGVLGYFRATRIA